MSARTADAPRMPTFAVPPRPPVPPSPPLEFGAFGAIEYPSTDGEPMAETDLDRSLMFDAIARLTHRYAGDPAAYVSGNLLVYYQEGAPHVCLAPDCFVAFGVPKGNRDAFMTWVERAYPAVVFEFTSKSTSGNDLGKKFAVYQDVWRVDEYFLFDPYGEYLEPPLQGYRRDARGRLATIPPDADGGLLSERLNLTIRRDGSSLTFRDAATGEPVLNADEAEARAAQDEARAEAAARRDAEARLADALAELARLKKSP